MCWKIPHKTQKDARLAMVSHLNRAGSKRPGKIMVYLCAECGKWHWGHEGHNFRKRKYG